MVKINGYEYLIIGIDEFSHKYLTEKGLMWKYYNEYFINYNYEFIIWF